VLAVLPWGGQVATTSVTATSFVFVGPTITVETTQNRRLSASASWTFVPSIGTNLYVDVCYGLPSGAVLSPNNGFKVVPSTAGVRQLVSIATSFALGPGSYRVGACVRGRNASLTVNGSTDDWSTGWVMLTSTEPAQAAAEALGARVQPRR
jgi:hypothetical protein